MVCFSALETSGATYANHTSMRFESSYRHHLISTKVSLQADIRLSEVIGSSPILPERGGSSDGRARKNRVIYSEIRIWARLGFDGLNLRIAGVGCVATTH